MKINKTIFLVLLLLAVFLYGQFAINSYIFFLIFSSIIIIGIHWYYLPQTFHHTYWIAYYIILTVFYFSTGIIQNLIPVDIDLRYIQLLKLYWGMIQLIPIFILFAALFKFRLLRKKFKPLLILFGIVALLCFSNLRNSSLIDTFGLFRNISLPIVFFILGTFYAHIAKKNMLYNNLYLYVLFTCLFVILDFFFGRSFYSEMYPCREIMAIYTGQLDSGFNPEGTLLLKRSVKIMGAELYRSAGIQLTAAHSAYMYSGFTIWMLAFFKTKLFYIFSVLLLTFCVIICFIKAAWFHFCFTLVLITTFYIFHKCGIWKKCNSFFLFIIAAMLTFISVKTVLTLGFSSNTLMGHIRLALDILTHEEPINFLSAGSQVLTLNVDNAFFLLIKKLGLVGYALYVIVLLRIIGACKIACRTNWIAICAVSTILSWVFLLHLASSMWTPVALFMIFFVAGTTCSLDSLKRV